LYGYHQGLDQIRRGRSLVLSEGYTDVIMAHQYGFGNTVAVLGTALTEEGVQLISRKVDRVDLLFDGDVAGKKAASKCCELFLGTEVEVRVVILESGVDPCDLLSSEGGKEAYESFLAAGISSLEFLIRDILEQHEFEPGVSSMRTVSRVRKELSRRVLEPLSDMGQIPLEEAVRRISVETRWSEASIHQDFLADRDQRIARRRPEGRGSAGRVGPGNFDGGPVPIVEDSPLETEVILGDYGPGSSYVGEPGVEKPADASPGSPEAAHDPEYEHIMIKMVLRDESYYRPLFRIHPPERWRAPLHRELALLVLSQRGVPDPEEVSSSGLKSLILDILSFISVEDEMIPDPDERNLLVPQYMAEILVTELERKRHQLVLKGEARDQIQSINDQIQTLTSSKFLFDNPSQVDEIINRFELESLGSTSTQKSEEQERTIHE
ncbi:MAG: toprim domain-containing protein, partial [Planctomycetota bacterium]